MATEKELLMLDSLNPIVTSVANKWCSVGEADVINFIQNIKTSESSASGKKDLFRAMISGVPSPWARVMLTRKALLNPLDQLGSSVLDECYKLFRSEWRGLMAAYVLRPELFEFSAPIALSGKSVEDNRGELSVRYMYGKMLFDETPLWAHERGKIDAATNPPYIQILYFKKKEGGGFKRIPVGATSPYTYLFTAVGYSLKGAQKEIPWIDQNDGKFTDPTHLERVFTTEERQRLYAFIDVVMRNLQPGENDQNNPDKFYIDWLEAVCDNSDNSSEYKINLTELRDNIGGWQEELRRWQQELQDEIESAGDKVNSNIPLFCQKPQGPLSILLNCEHKYYFADGTFSANPNNGCEILSSEIFIDSDYIAAWHNEPSEGKDYSKASAYYIITGDGKYALPLPLSSKAIEVFGIEIGVIMSGDGAVKLEASTTDDGRVEIVMKAKLDKVEDNEIPVCKKTYSMEVINEGAGKVFVWPNFCSTQWKKYYLYNEFPGNVPGVRMVPLFKDIDFNTATEEEKSTHYMVRYPLGRVSSDSHKYEIIETSTPLERLSIRINKAGEDLEAGWLMVKRSQKADPGIMKEIPTLSNLREAIVGIDYGSTNTCAYYRLPERNEAMPVPFSNRRLALVGFDNGPRKLACKDELYFISNEGTAFPNGQVKSWIHLHDPQYLTNDGNLENIADLSREIVGGIPVNEANIVVKSMTEEIITTNAGDLHYNMKWLSEKESVNRKIAFMKMLWIHLCADMADSANPAYPKKLYWSFPSSMTTPDRMNLKRIYLLATEMPIDSLSKPKLSDYTESESVCAYAIHSGMEIDERKIILGIDVGGSTSDLLILGMKDGQNALVSQSSIRLAGGFFFKAINSSPKFRKTLFNFHESHNTGVDVKNIKDVTSLDSAIYGRAPYYLNCVFDQLYEQKDFKTFYNYLSLNAPAVFAYPAYVTGVLMFYSGMLVRNAVEKKGLSEARTVQMRYYGKGGRLFEWLLDINEDNLKYYRKCFNAGYGSQDGSQDMKIVFDNVGSDNARRDSKSEVAIGLVSDLFGNIARGREDEDGERIIEKCDVVGEKGFRYSKDNKALDELEQMPDGIFDGGINLTFPDKLENFSSFIGIYTKFLQDNFSGALSSETINMLNKGKDGLRIRAFIMNDREYNKCVNAFDKDAPEGKRPIFKMPLFVAAALCYLEDVLLPAISKQMQ